jgi:hypothetical protein
VAAQRSSETNVDLQKIRRELTKLNDILHAIVEGGARAGVGERSGAREMDGEAVEMRGRREKFTMRTKPILNLLSHATVREYFGTDDHEAIEREINTQEGL